jgi:hypothetical protein
MYGSKKAKRNKRPDSTTKVSDNIGILPSGIYRARKMINGVAYSQNFSSKAKAKRWISNL